MTSDRYRGEPLALSVTTVVPSDRRGENRP